MVTGVVKSIIRKIIFIGSLSNIIFPFFSTADLPPGSLTAAIIGGSGAVGGEVITHLLQRDAWRKVIAISRRYLKIDSPRFEQRVINTMGINALQAECAKLKDVDTLFITMGVGAAGKVSEEELRKVDIAYPTAAARGARDAGVRHVLILTAVGADFTAGDGIGLGPILPKTRNGGSLYNQCKGRVESNIAKLEFPLGFSAFRPAALIGTPNTNRIVSKIAPKLDKILPARYKSAHINTIAAAMVYEAERRVETQWVGIRIFSGKTLNELYCEIPFVHGAPGDPFKAPSRFFSPSSLSPANLLSANLFFKSRKELQNAVDNCMAGSSYQPPSYSKYEENK